MELVEANSLFRFHSWDEVSEVIREIRDRCQKVETSVQDMPGVIPINRLKELILIKKRISQLNMQFDVINRSISFLRTVPKVGRESEVVEKKFNELYQTFRELRERIEKEFLGQLDRKGVEQ